MTTPTQPTCITAPAMLNEDLFASVPPQPEDAMFGLSAACRADTHPDKVDLGVGAYRDEHGAPWILPSVRAAEQRIPLQSDYSHEYQPIAGLGAFRDASARLVFGADAEVLKVGRVATVQTLSGTGALHLGAALLAGVLPQSERTVHVSDPPYVNHEPIFAHAGFRAARYPYYLRARRGVDAPRMLAALEALPAGSLVLLHACAHNPTGADPGRAQWQAVSAAMRRRRLVPFFDMAYQGFASGDADADARVVRQFVADGCATVLVAQSYAKNFGLYGERVGCLHVVAGSRVTAGRVLGQLERIQRREVSTAPAFGARIVAMVLNDERLMRQWREDLMTIATRMGAMRRRLRALLEEGDGQGGEGGRWRHLTEQRGMFCYTGLTEEQVATLRREFHVYMTKDGRISVAGLNESNVERTAEAIRRVVGGTRSLTPRL